jgi:formylmethanofuran dehydrogenase subunit B
MPRVKREVECTVCGRGCDLIIVYVEDWSVEPLCWGCLISRAYEVGKEFEKVMAGGKEQ